MSGFLRKNGAWIGFGLLALVLTIATDGGFLSARNLTNLIRQASINGILASGMTVIIITGGIDLSIGSIAALAGVTAGITQVFWGWAGLGAMGALGTLLMGCGVGLLSGILTGGLVAWLGIAPFVITLGLMVVARGLALIFSEGASISPMGDALGEISSGYLPQTFSVVLTLLVLAGLAFHYRRRISEGVFPLLTFMFLAWAFLSYRGFPTLAIFLLVTTCLVSFLLNHTVFGRSVYAIGSNERAAFWAGVPIRKVKWLVYSLMGLLAGLTGVLLTARLNGADPNSGQLFELDAIAAAVIGGTRLQGGVGTVMGAFIGALTIATLNNGMDLLGVTSFYQMVFKGAVIVIAVSLDKSQKDR